MIKIGDRVGYSAKFLVSTGQQIGEAGFQRGKVIDFEPFGQITLAVIEWDNPEWNIPCVNVANLAKVGSAAMSIN